MDKRVVLFLILSLAIILGYDYLLKQMGIIAPPASNESTTAPVASPSESSRVPNAPSTGSPLSSTEPSPLPGQVGTAPEPSKEQVLEVETDLFRAVFTTRGAGIKSLELKRYRTSQEQPKLVELTYIDGKFRQPLSIQTAEPAISKQLNEGLYQVQRDFSVLDAAHPTGRLIFTYHAPQSGVTVVKELMFHYNRYLVDVSIKTEGLAGPFDVSLGTNFGIVEWGEGFIGLIGPAVMVDGKLVKDMPDTEREHVGSLGWVAIQDKYFLSVLIPDGAHAAVVRKEGEKLVSAAVRFVASGPRTEAKMRMYAGPKEYDTLKSLNVGLEDTIDFGWFIYGSWGIVKAVAKPLFYVLRFLYEFAHNYGVAIILLTVGIKLLFVPLQYKSYKSMKDMQAIQPKVVELQAKYKDDRERLNRELIKLYRDHKVNPVGGCLPMLLQMPVFVALFNILYMTIDLRQAPFILWIKDLSAQDPYYVLPILMGASMVLQQKIMPTTMDPTQAKIMLLLPAFMTLLFLTFPAGLVLYWLTNNVITIAQQFITDRYIFKKPTFSSPSSALAPSHAGDGKKPVGKKKKDKSGKSETDSPVET